MPSAHIFADFIWPDASAILSALLVVLFLIRGLYRVYPFFFAYWIFDLFIWALPLVVADFPTQMFVTLICFTLRCFLYFLMAIELVDRILQDRPGLATVGRRAVQGAMVVAAAVAIYTLRFDSEAQKSVGNRLHLLLQLERVTTGCLLLFLTIIVAFLWFFPVRMNRTTKAYCFGFATFFLVKAVVPFVINRRGLDVLDSLSTIQVVAVLSCQIMWLIALSKHGTEASPAFPRNWSMEEQERILATLNSFEHQISRSRRR